MTSRLIAIFLIQALRRDFLHGTRKGAVSAPRKPNARGCRDRTGGDSDLHVTTPHATLASMPHTRTAPAIRRAIPADIDALLALEESTFDSDRISRAQWRRHIRSGSAAVFVSGTPGNVDAAAVVFYRRNARAARLYSLAVGTHARGSGLGGALLVAAEVDARGRGCTSMRLEVRADNPSAIALYERRGYTRVARLPGFYEDGAAAWRYGKALVSGAP